MKYCTFKYQIKYDDGETCEGWTPFKGESLSNAALIQFVQHYFQERKTAHQIFIHDVFEISKHHIWLAHIRNTVEYRFLKARGFNAD